MSRWRHGKDQNHKTIVEIFRLLGCSIVVIDRASYVRPDGTTETAGVPDLLVGRNGADILVEVKPEAESDRTVDGVTKRGTKKAESMPREKQREFATRWKGRWVEVVRNAEDAARVANGLGSAMPARRATNP